LRVITCIFIGVQIGHPPADVAHLVTTEMTIRMTAKVLFCAPALAGLAGLFVRHRHQLGRLGRVGYSLLSVGFLAMLVQESSSATTSRRWRDSAAGPAGLDHASSSA
jgi:hypothetical protein